MNIVTKNVITLAYLECKPSGMYLAYRMGPLSVKMLEYDPEEKLYAWVRLFRPIGRPDSLAFPANCGDLHQALKVVLFRGYQVLYFSNIRDLVINLPKELATWITSED